MTSPRLFHDLRAALACLYTLSPHNDESMDGDVRRRRAHDFLLHLQCRNVRRKLNSIRQSNRDQRKHNLSVENDDYNDDASKLVEQVEEEDGDGGSTWLACLALLSYAPAHSAERLFAAQTLMHRVRRTKLSEAIDLEMEDPRKYLTTTTIHVTNTTPSQQAEQGREREQVTVNLQPLASDYVGWMQHFHPLLGYVAHQFVATHCTTTVLDEEQLKGHLAMLTLAAIMYLTTATAEATSDDAEASNNNNKNGHQSQPLLVTLASTLAAIALRLRFTPTSIPRAAAAAATTTTSSTVTPTSAPLVTMIVHSLTTTASAAAAVASNDSSSTSSGSHEAILVSCLLCCGGVLPEAIVSSGGGAMGRISMDPRCLCAAHEELKQPTTGIYLLWEALDAINPTIMRAASSHVVVVEEDNCFLFWKRRLLTTWQKWAKCLPLPQDFVDATVPMASQLLVLSSGNTTTATTHLLIAQETQTAALSYLTAIFESGSWTAQFILTFSLGLSSEQLSAGSQPVNKKRQTSRSKRRQKERIDTSATDSLRAQAEAECLHRGAMACRTMRLAWEGLVAAVQASPVPVVPSSVNNYGGEGPLVCLCAAANACLPHWLRHASSSEDSTLALSVMGLLQRISSHDDRAVRALSYEPLCTLNMALLESARVRHEQVPPQPPCEMEALVVNHLFQSTMRLASACGYPLFYFDVLDADNDEEVEVERNDVRDLIRAVCGCEESETSVPMDVSMQVLNQIVQSCADACDSGTALPRETAVHALSALAKPLNSLARAYAHGYRCHGIYDILEIPIRSLGRVHRNVVLAFESTVNFRNVFPVCRLVNVATAAYAPALSAMCKLEVSSSEPGHRMSGVARETVAAAVHGAALSLTHIPELVAESTLDHTQYDIRGAMRGPGGEDHVGVLALMRPLRAMSLREQ